MKKASGQWLESAEMDLGSIDRILQTLDRSVKCQELTPKTEQWCLMQNETRIPACHAGHLFIVGPTGMRDNYEERD